MDYILNEKEIKIIKLFIKNLLINSKLLRDFEEFLPKFINDKRLFHPKTRFLQKILKYKFLNNSNNLNLENFLLFMLSIWSEREKKSISLNFIDFFNNTFYWDHCDNYVFDYKIRMRDIHYQFEKFANEYIKIDPEFAKIIEKLNRGYNLKINERFKKSFKNKKY